jgi:hypothetical protein
MQATSNRPRQYSAILVATLLTATMLFAVTPSSALIGLPDLFGNDSGNDDGDFNTASHSTHFLFDLTQFEQRGPPGHGSWSVTPTSAEQTVSGEYMTLLVADDSQVGGALYRDVRFTADITTAGVQDNIFGFAAGLQFPTGTGTMIDAYIVDWGGADQTYIGHTKPEGFTIYHIAGQLPGINDANYEDQAFACFWAKDDDACTSATITVLNTNHDPGTGWLQNEEYETVFRYDEGRIQLNVRGGQFSSWTNVVSSSAGPFPIGEFGLFSFRQPVTFENVGFRDVIAPTFDLQTRCAGGSIHIVDGEEWCDGNAQFRIRNANDDGSGVDTQECFLNGDLLQVHCNAYRSVGADGVHTVTAVVRDVRGNTATETIELRQDSGIPEFAPEAVCASLPFPGDWCRSSVSLTGGATAPSGIASSECAIRADHLGETTFTALSDCGEFSQDGEFTYYANATSGVGGFNESDDLTFRIDATAPVGQLLSPAPFTSYLNGVQVDCLGIRVGLNAMGVRATTPTDCLASGTIDVQLIAEDPENNGIASGIWKVEFWDGVGSNMFRVEGATIYGEEDFYNFTWDTTRAPSPSEPHFFQTRTLEARIWDNAGNFHTLERHFFVIPPTASLDVVPENPELPDIPDQPEVPEVPGVPTEPTPLGDSQSGDLGFDPRDNSTWSLEDLYGQQLLVEKVLTTSTLEFHIHTPNNLTGDTGFDNFALLVDLNSNGRATWQVTYRAWEADPWGFQQPFVSDTCGWQEADRPAGITVTNHSANHFVISVPTQWFVTNGGDYRYGVYNINHGPQTPLGPNDAQVHMPFPETKDLFNLENGPTDNNGNPCWFSSDNYQPASFGLWG